MMGQGLSLYKLRKAGVQLVVQSRTVNTNMATLFKDCFPGHSSLIILSKDLLIHCNMSFVHEALK